MSADDKAAAAWDDYVSQQREEKIEELERQLNAANERIKRLEEALEECDWAFTKFCPEHESRYGDAWEKVRDALNRPNPFKPYWQEAKP